MRHHSSVQYLILLLAASSLLACDPGTLSGTAASSKDSGPVAGHRVVKILPPVDFKSPGGFGYLLLPQVMFESDDGIYWIGSLTALHTYDESREYWGVLGGGDSDVPLGVDTICQSADHKIWLRSVLYPSLRTYDGHGWNTEERVGPDRSNRLPQVMFQGREGRIWVILKEGISSYDGREWSKFLRPSREFEEHYARLKKPLIDSASRFEAVRQQRTRSTPALGRNDKTADEERDGLITEVCVGLEARSGELWLGSRHSLVVFESVNRDWKAHALPEGSGRPRRVFEDKDGGLWIADNKGQVLLFDPHHLRWTTFDVKNLVPIPSVDVGSDLLINGICQDKQGHIILASNNGIISFDQGNETWSLFAAQNGAVADSNMISMMQDRRGRIWLGTTNGISILQE